MSAKPPTEPITIPEVVEAASACSPSLATCACECLLMPEFVANWNRLRPEYPIAVRSVSYPIDIMIDKATGAPPIIWSPETRSRFFQFVEMHVRRPVERRIMEESLKQLNIVGDEP